MKILGVKVDDITLRQAVAVVSSWLESDKKRIFTIVTPNPEIIVQAQDDLQLRKILNEADLAIPDGVGLRWFGGAKNTVPGTTLMEELCRVAASYQSSGVTPESGTGQTEESSSAGGWTVGLYGGEGKVAQKALGTLKERFPGLQGWARIPPKLSIANFDKHMRGKVSNSKEELEVKYLKKKIEETDTRLLFVGLGAPKQEFFMEKLLLKVQSQTKTFGSVLDRGSRVKERKKEKNKKLASSLVLMTVGGAFDEIAGKVRPAPEWVSRAGFKWLWRLFWQPWRIKRQLRLGKFVYLMIRKRYL